MERDLLICRELEKNIYNFILLVDIVNVELKMLKSLDRGPANVAIIKFAYIQGSAPWIYI